MNTHMIRYSLTLLLGLATVAIAADKGEDYKPEIKPADFTTKITNPYFPLVPGTVFKYLETNGKDKADNIVEVTHETKVIMGVTCVVVHDKLVEDGQVKEDTFDWYAQHKDGSVWYFGEATKEFKSGGRVSTEGSWEAGVGGAQPGIIMPGELKVGHRYREEYLRSVAEDMGEVSALSESATAPAGEFKDCVRIKDWNMLESGSSKKWFAKGVGNVRTEATDGELSVLISVSKP
jgi:hypothetical protein